MVTISSRIRSVLAVVVFSGLFSWAGAELSSILGVDWGLQVIVVAILLAMSLPLKPSWPPIFLTAISLVLMIFASSSSYWRTSGAYWWASQGKDFNTRSIAVASRIGVLVGSVAIVYTAYITVFVENYTRTPSGFFASPSLSLMLVFGLLIDRKISPAFDWWQLLIWSLATAAIFLSGARVSIFALTIVLILSLRWRAAAVALGALIVAAPLFLGTSGNPPLAVKWKIAGAPNEFQSFLQLDSETRSETSPVTSGVERGVGIERIPQVIKTLPDLDANPNDVGHVGWVHVVDTLGIPIFLVILLLALFVLNPLQFLLLAYLSFFFTDPFLSFGPALLLLGKCSASQSISTLFLQWFGTPFTRVQWRHSVATLISKSEMSSCQNRFRPVKGTS